MARGDPLTVVEEAYEDLVAERTLLTDVNRRDAGEPRVYVTWEKDGLYRSITSKPLDNEDRIAMSIDVWYDKPDNPDAHVSMGTQYYRTIRVGTFPAEYQSIRDACEVAYATASIVKEEDLDQTVRRDM